MTQFIGLNFMQIKFYFQIAKYPAMSFKVKVNWILNISGVCS